MIVSPVSTVGALHVTLNTPRCGSGETVTPLGAGGAAAMRRYTIHTMQVTVKITIMFTKFKEPIAVNHSSELEHVHANIKQY